jgi:thiol-disulfide isomerase/thioredoxin
MRSRSIVTVLLDGLAGLTAITVVVGSCFASERISLDFRLIFALTSGAFFAAGIARGSPQRPRSVWQIMRISAPGLLGTAALLVNNGFHQLAMPASLILIAVFMVGAGDSVRRAFSADRRKSLILASGALVLAAVAAMLVIPQLSAHSAYDAQRRPATPFDLSIEGRTVSSSDLHGRVVVLAFWTSWCISCIQELPQLQRIYEHFRNDPRVAIYAVDVGWNGETRGKGGQCLARRRLDLPMAFDSGVVAKGFGIDGVPEIVLIDADGRTRFTHYGYDAAENFEEGLTRHIDDLLANR